MAIVVDALLIRVSTAIARRIDAGLSSCFFCINKSAEGVSMKPSKVKVPFSERTVPNKLAYISFGITLIIVVLAFSEQIVGYINFIQNDGYANQLDMVQSSGGQGTFAAFTSPSQESHIEIVLANIAFAMMVVQTLLIAVYLFITSGVPGKILSVVFSVPAIAVIILFILDANGLFGVIGIERESTFYQFLMEYGQIIIRGGLIFALALLITSLANEHTRVLSLIFIFGIIVYAIIAPLVFWLLKNFIPLVSLAGMVVFGILVIAALFAVSKFIPAEGGSSSNSTIASGNSNNSSSKATASQRKLTYGLSNPNFRKTRGKSFGMEVEGVFCTGAQGQEIYVCSVEDFEKGKVAVMNNGTRITRVAGCKAPER